MDEIGSNYIPEELNKIKPEITKQLELAKWIINELKQEGWTVSNSAEELLKNLAQENVKTDLGQAPVLSINLRDLFPRSSDPKADSPTTTDIFNKAGEYGFEPCTAKDAIGYCRDKLMFEGMNAGQTIFGMDRADKKTLMTRGKSLDTTDLVDEDWDPSEYAFILTLSKRAEAAQ